MCLDKTSYNRNIFQNKSYQGTKQKTGKTIICFSNAFYAAFVSVNSLVKNLTGSLRIFKD